MDAIWPTSPAHVGHLCPFLASSDFRTAWCVRPYALPSALRTGVEELKKRSPAEPLAERIDVSMFLSEVPGGCRCSFEEFTEMYSDTSSKLEIYPHRALDCSLHSGIGGIGELVCFVRAKFRGIAHSPILWVSFCSSLTVCSVPVTGACGWWHWHTLDFSGEEEKYMFIFHLFPSRSSCVQCEQSCATPFDFSLTLEGVTVSEWAQSLRAGFS